MLLPCALPPVYISFEGIMQGNGRASELLRSGRESLIFNDEDTFMPPFAALEDALVQLEWSECTALSSKVSGSSETSRLFGLGGGSIPRNCDDD
jgi:hypothetical protein